MSLEVMRGPHDLELSVIDGQEADTILDAFNADIAFEIGLMLRERARSDYDRPVLIQISSATGVVYFQSCSRPGVNPDNMAWAARKRNTVVRFYRSTFFMGCKLRREGRTLEQAFFIPESEFCTHGGGFPLRVKGSEGIQGVVVVSGLAQHDDHDLIVTTLLRYVCGETTASQVHPSSTVAA